MSINPSSLRGGAMRLLGGLGLLAATGLARAEYRLNFQRPVTEVARDVYGLHMLIFSICVVIFIVVFGVMFYSLWAHRKSRGHQAATFHESTTLEVVWTIIPFVILVVMAVPSTATLLKMDNVSDSEMSVKITGYQWKWKYDYMDQDISFISTLATPTEQIEGKAKKDDQYLLEVDKPVVLPVGKKIRFLITANDVIHAWWVPQLGVKKDAIPGFINEVWARIDEPGTYRGQCAELCGKGHGFMPIVVKAVSQEDFDAWVKKQKALQVAAAGEAAKTWTRGELMARGKTVYGQCAACHGASGQGVPGVFPAMAGSKVATGPVADHIKTVLHGRPGTAMQAFGPQLSDTDIAAVVTYERNAFGNNTGDVVQPSDVKALR